MNHNDSIIQDDINRMYEDKPDFVFNSWSFTQKEIYTTCSHCRMRLFKREDEKYFCMNNECPWSLSFYENKKRKEPHALSSSQTGGFDSMVFFGVLKFMACSVFSTLFFILSLTLFHDSNNVGGTIVMFMSLVIGGSAIYYLCTHVFGSKETKAYIELTNREHSLSEDEEYNKRKALQEEREARIVSNVLKGRGLPSGLSDAAKARIKRSVKTVRAVEGSASTKLAKQADEFNRIRERHKVKFTSKISSMSND